ncbi:hypothetical protein AOLI_G00307880 [Acnodon oligacanthus]
MGEASCPAGLINCPEDCHIRSTRLRFKHCVAGKLEAKSAKLLSHNVCLSEADPVVGPRGTVSLVRFTRGAHRRRGVT